MRRSFSLSGLVRGRRTAWAVAGALFAAAAGTATVVALNREARAAVIQYDLEYKAVTRALDGQKFPFIALGGAILDTETGDISYNANVEATGDAITGVGTLAVGPKTSYGTSSFDSGLWQGTAIYSGKFSKDLSKFKGKIVVAIPNHFGPTPNGFSYTTGKITLVRSETQPE